MAEAASDPTRMVPTPPDTTKYAVGPQNACVVGLPPALPSAQGGSSSPPHGWSILQHYIGYAWPNGHQDKLRSAATAWHDAAGMLSGMPSIVDQAVNVISLQQSPEVEDATVVCSSMSGHLTDIASECMALGDACGQLATHIDKAHHEIESACVSFVEWTVGIEVAGGLFSVITAGGSEVAAQAAEAAKAATTGTRIGEIIAALIGAASTLAARVAPIVARIAEVASKLKLILGAQLSRASVALSASLPTVAAGIEYTSTILLRAAADSAAGDDALYNAYAARKTAAGEKFLSREAWQRKLDTLRQNKLVGDTYRDDVAQQLGITYGKGGWTSEYTASEYGRRFDIANPATQTAIEVKSGSTPAADGLTQLSKDERALQDGWTITWQLKQPLSPTLMQRMQEMAAQYPRFHYTISGG